MPVILLRPRAQDDIAEIWGYIAEDSEQQADAFVDRLDAKFQLLARQPRLGHIREELAPGLRSFPVGRYVIFYETVPDGIAIVRVLHSARDIDAQFSGDPAEGDALVNRDPCNSNVINASLFQPNRIVQFAKIT